MNGNDKAIHIKAYVKMVYCYYIGNKHVLNVLHKHAPPRAHTHIQLFVPDYTDITNVIRVESSVSELAGF